MYGLALQFERLARNRSGSYGTKAAGWSHFFSQNSANESG